jgi:hypothetical protein
MISEQDKTMWIDALRSGHFEQIKETYTNMAGGYCAVGVLGAVVAERDGLEFFEALEDYTMEYGRRRISYKTLNEIFKLNDADFEFAVIADFIELNVPVFAEQKVPALVA